MHITQRALSLFFSDGFSAAIYVSLSQTIYLKYRRMKSYSAAIYTD